MATLERVKPRYTPKFKGVLEGWATNYIVKHIWRVQPEHDMDDLLQDAYCIFLTCRDKYPAVTEEAHFFSLFKRSLFNHIAHLSNMRTLRAEIQPDFFAQEGEPQSDGLANIQDTGLDVTEFELRVIIADAPEPYRTMMTKIMDEGLVEHTRVGQIRETTNQLLERLAGVKLPGVDIRGVIEYLVRGGTCVTD